MQKVETSKIINLNDTGSVYRFQGGNSYPCFSYPNNKSIPENYVYFSKSLNHHEYFTQKRLKQIIKSTVKNSPVDNFSYNKLKEDAYYRKLITYLANNLDDSTLESIKFNIDNSFIQLVEDNYVYSSDKKNGENLIERVDRKIYGGGYGINAAWTELFNSLTLYNQIKKISRNDIIHMLSVIKKSNPEKRNALNFLEQTEFYSYLNIDVYDDYKKYNIMSIMENIVDNGLYKENSNLHLKPNETIKSTISSYERSRKQLIDNLK